MNNCTIILLGATGDLAKKKIIPALYSLVHQGILNTFALIGVAHDAQHIPAFLEQARPYITQIDESSFARLSAHSSYQVVDFTRPQDFSALAQHVQRIEQEQSLSGNRLAYLATAADFFSPITRSLHAVGLVQMQREGEAPWQRIAYEKPFGHDGASAHAINLLLANYVAEHQIYRVDHYLTKDIVGSLALMRFTNCFFEPLWNNKYIDNVQIILREQVSIENRGQYYDAYGALKDVVQNHALELLALIGMEAPERLTGEHIRAQRAHVLEQVTVADALLGQYEGYRSEKGVKPDSATETFAVVAATINTYRWAGVPFYIKAGKCLDKKETVIHIQFKPVDSLLAQRLPTQANHLTIRIAPESFVALSLNTKKPGANDELVPVTMTYRPEHAPHAYGADAYEAMFMQILRGEQAVSVRFDEIEAAWKIIDAIHAQGYAVYSYAKGSTGPSQEIEFCNNHGFRWQS